jgi:hypothetical protein
MPAGGQVEEQVDRLWRRRAAQSRWSKPSSGRTGAVVDHFKRSRLACMSPLDVGWWDLDGVAQVKVHNASRIW